MRSLFHIAAFALPLLCAAQQPATTFVANKGQWPAKVLFRGRVPGGVVFIEQDRFTYVLYSGGALAHHGHEPVANIAPLVGHAYQMIFQGGNASHSEGRSPQPGYENHFIGDDPARWGTACGIYAEVVLHDLYPGVDLHVDGRQGLKYTFHAAPGSPVDDIRLLFSGQDALALENDALSITTSVAVVTEHPPTSWLLNMNGTRGPDVGTTYRLEGNTVHFTLDDHDERSTLVIDPLLTFASYSGSSADNFGFTATYDEAGHLYGGGIVFNPGYPTTLGALQDDWAGGDIDVGITKWSADGSTLLWSTYFGGGTGSETPHSMVVNEQEELYLMGATGSSDLPTTASAYDDSFNGGPTIDIFNGGWQGLAGGYGFDHLSGTDIYLAHLNASGTTLLGSTYIGGSGNDGVNNVAVLAHNYGDAFRGEVALDENEWPVVATSTSSDDMPVSAGAPQASFGGGVQDGYCFRLNPACSSLQWGTYLGGSGDDNGLGIQFDSAWRMFVSGGTTSSDLPMSGSPFDPSFGGVADGYLMRYSDNGSTLLSSTHLGTTDYDQAYFVQLDPGDAVYAVGQTFGSYPVTPGKYNVPNSGQFIHKLSNDLSASQWSTRIGNGDPQQSLSPTAFLVSDCGQIYVSGWAGNTNANAGNTTSSTNGLPVTPDAFQPATDGSDVYLLMLDPDAAGLHYATFFGGGISREHVDGGTSRFDKDGTVYHAVCAGCGSHDDFPTTPGAWSTTNNSANCNLGVFKFELAAPLASVAIDGPNIICFPDTVQFINYSSGGDTYVWNFGDGATSAEFEPSHIYLTEGVFSITVVMTDSYGCSISDTASIQVTSLPTPAASIAPILPICPGSSVQLNASDGLSWSWYPNIGMNDPALQNPTVTPPEPMTYSVIVESGCGIDTATVDVVWAEPDATAGPDTSTCLGSGVALNASGGGTYAWQPHPTLSSTTGPSPVATPSDSTAYVVDITTPEGCLLRDTVSVLVYVEPPLPSLMDTAVCEGTQGQLFASDAVTYAWQPSEGISDLFVRDPIITPTAPTWYVVLLGNPCGSTWDSAFVDLITVQPLAWPDTLVCPNRPVELHASGGVAYHWTPSAGLDNDTIADPIAVAPANTIYSVEVTDENGCSATAQVTIVLRPLPAVQAGPDVIIDYGTTAQLNATGDGTLSWSPGIWLDDSTSASPFTRPEETITYTVTVTDADGCTNTDVLVVILNGTLFIPNAFTPNGDGINDMFGAFGKNLRSLELMVFNRWGELIWSTEQLGGRWNGTYQGAESPIDTYVWKVQALELSGRRRAAVGHVNLLR